jgi:hypothetical protein
MFYDDDIDTFLSTDEFAKGITWVDVGESNNVSHAISAIFDNPGQLQNIGNIGIIIQDITITVKASDVSGLEKRDQFIIDSVTYKIKDYQDDGTGIMRITLATGMR